MVTVHREAFKLSCYKLTFWYTSISSRVMLLPEGDGARPPEDGDGVFGSLSLGLFLLPNSLLGNLAMSLFPLLPLACLLKLSTCVSPVCISYMCNLWTHCSNDKGKQVVSSYLEVALMTSQCFQMRCVWRAIVLSTKSAWGTQLYIMVEVSVTLLHAKNIRQVRLTCKILG